MTEISAARVKDLRDRTGAGMMDCKRALAENGGDLEQAIDWLRKKGLAAAAKKGGRATADGLIGLKVDQARAAMIEVNSETDFVSRNPDFQTFVGILTTLALQGRDDDVAGLNTMAFPDAGRSVADQLTHMIATMGENMNLRRVAVIEVEPGVIGAYVHNQVSDGLGKIGVLVALASEGPREMLAPLARQLAMHIAAANPSFISRDDVDAGSLERERAVLSDQARASGKPEAVIEKMVEGRLRKYYEDVCLLDQTFVIDGESKVAQVIEKATQDAGTPIRVAAFRRFALGEGVERKEEDFAAEVARTAGA